MRRPSAASVQSENSGPEADTWTRSWSSTTIERRRGGSSSVHEASQRACSSKGPSGPDPEIESKRERIVLTGDVPRPDQEIVGCPFKTRCPKVFDRCEVEAPELKTYRPNHEAACHLHE